LQHIIPLYSLIDGKISEMREYAQDWLQYQALWDLDSNSIYEYLGKDLSKWQEILSEIKKARSTFDNSNLFKDFGYSVVMYDKVQGKVMSKYDSLQREIVYQFGSRMMEGMKLFRDELSSSRAYLESHSLDSDSTGAAVSLVTLVQSLKSKNQTWSNEVEVFTNGQKLLEKYRFHFPQDWIYAENIEGEWSAFTEIFNRKNSAIRDRIGKLH
jgi:dynein heavy chain 1